MTAYYNEIDPYAAQWLRNLIGAGHIAPGIVDERSIEDIRPGDLAGFTQCHFFAGVGVRSLALRRAGWDDSRPVWTGSCPCQPFSAAGAGGGFADERHLWPSFAWLIGQCKPSVIFGEQVASKAVEPWVDLVHADLEAMGYAFGAVPFPSAGVGAPHIRDRLYWVADSQSDRHEWPGEFDESARRDGASHLRTIGGLANADGRNTSAEGEQRGRQQRQQPENSAVVRLAQELGRATANATAGFWKPADWIFCRDEQWRPVESGTFPLAHGAPSRMGRLRAYGNAINAEAARIFIEAYLT